MDLEEGRGCSQGTLISDRVPARIWGQGGLILPLLDLLIQVRDGMALQDHLDLLGALVFLVLDMSEDNSNSNLEAPDRISKDGQVRVLGMACRRLCLLSLVYHPSRMFQFRVEVDRLEVLGRGIEEALLAPRIEIRTWAVGS
jgi:hypothetical protein